MTAAQFEDAEGRALVEAIHRKLAEKSDGQRIDLDTPGVRYAALRGPNPDEAPTHPTRTGTL